MTPHSFSLIWAAVAPELGNHLWQSTLFIGVVALLNLALRKYQARWRYCLWLAASAKFLIPFSLLVGMGGHLVWSVRSPGPKPGMYAAINEMGQPFTDLTALNPPMPSIAAHPLASPHPAALFSDLLTAVWLCGFIAVLTFWYVQWRRISIAVRQAKPLREGREVEILRRIERLAKSPRQIELLLSRSAMEPGVFGVFRPILLWPEGISRHLDDAHLEAVLAHEVWHVKRRDNLTSAMHMLVEALFWFHPLVWWLEARLIDERERACDEEVLRIGKQPQVYAESILKVCEFCVESPLSCVSGITGADLKKRIVQIMTERVARKMDFSKKLLLVVVGLMAVCVPIVFGQVIARQSMALPNPAPPPPPPPRPRGAGRVNPPQSEATPQNPDAQVAAESQSFEVATIKPSDPSKRVNRLGFSRDKFETEGQTLRSVIKFAYNLNFGSDQQISGGPSWVGTAKFDIQAKEDASLVEELQKFPEEERREKFQLLVQQLLAERFNLKVHHEMKELPVYAMTVVKSGLKITSASDPVVEKGPNASAPQNWSGINMDGRGQLEAKEAPLDLFANILGLQPEIGGRMVLNRTGLKGRYDFKLTWSPNEGMGESPSGNTGASPEVSGASLFTAMNEQLGLRLDATKGPVDTLVIDHVEMPSEN